MLCEVCKNNQATFHYRANENGKITETHMCHNCAKKAGLIEDSGKLFGSFGINDSFFQAGDAMLSDILSGMFAPAEKKAVTEATVCPFCGMRLSEFAKGGKAGCAKCYGTFKNALSKAINKLHGNTKHTGKIPAGRTFTKTKEQQKAEYEALMKKAVDEQEYEKAAEYRDKIKALDAQE